MMLLAQKGEATPGESGHTATQIETIPTQIRTMNMDEHKLHKAELVDGVKKSHLVTLILHNNSATTTQCPDGYKPKPEDIPYPRPNNVFEEALAVSAMFLAFTLGVLLPFILMSCIPAVIFYRSKVAAALLVITTVDWLLPAGKLWLGFRSAYFWDVMRRHFRLRNITPPVPFLDISKPLLGIHFPHAVFPMANMLNPPLFGLPGTGTPEDVEGVIGGVLLTLPFYKHIFAWMGAHPADATTFRNLLRRVSVGMQPEGLAGMTNGATPTREAIYISKRKGFIRIAIQCGADICPVYHLGQSQILSFWGPDDFIRRSRMLVGFMWGRWYLPIPRQHDIVSVGGHPIKVKQCDNPTDEEVDRVHAQVVEAIVQLYERYKHLIPSWESRPLHVR